MRKPIAIILLLGLLYQSIGYIMVFNTNFMLCRKEMKRKIKAGLSDEELTYFKFSKATYEDLDWIHPKEFKLKDSMYDVVKTKELTNDSIEVACVNDVKEQTLFANLNEQIQQFNDIQNDGKPISKVLLKLVKIQAVLKANETPSYISIETFKYPIIEFKTLNPFHSTILQPPDKIYFS